jgi:hypothetical protein
MRLEPRAESTSGGGLGELTDTAELIASEMTGNAVNTSAPVLAASRSLVIRLCLVTGGKTLTIECRDQAPGVPVLSMAPGLAETGRGLAIIDVLIGGAWGCRPVIGQADKCVWAEIPVSDVSAPLAALDPVCAAVPRGTEESGGRHD